MSTVSFKEVRSIGVLQVLIRIINIYSEIAVCQVLLFVNCISFQLYKQISPLCSEKTEVKKNETPWLESWVNDKNELQVK